MSKVSSINPSLDAQTQKPDDKITHQRVWLYLLEGIIVLAMISIVLLNAASFQMFSTGSDVGRYQCYALAFWKGIHGIGSLLSTQCSFLQTEAPSSSLLQNLKSAGVPASVLSLAESQSGAQPFHALPYEYPLLSLIPFSLPLITPMLKYQFAFGLWMALTAAVIFFMLKLFRSTGAAIAFAIYLVISSWGLAAGRFDLIPAALVLGAVILAERAKWKWAFALLAMATLLKVYPAVLLPPFLIAQQKCSSGKWYTWQRWDALGVFIGICATATGISLALSVVDTLSPLPYFLNRPVQIESSAAVLLWLGSLIGYPLHFTKAFGAVNAISPLSHRISLLSTLCLGGGFLYTLWLQWRGKLDVSTVSLLLLLIVLITGKVFSPQYLIWVVPLAAYVGKSNWKWLVSWGSAALLTTVIWPYLYEASYSLHVPLKPDFFPVVLARNLIILMILLALLWRTTRRTLYSY